MEPVEIGKKAGVISQDSLDLEWVAFYRDGTELTQNYHQGIYDPESEKYSEEHDFGDIDQSKLIGFGYRNLGGSLDPLIYLNLENGLFVLAGFPLYAKVLDKPDDGAKRELIMFRRTRQDYTPDGVVIRNRYGLGFKAKYIHPGTGEEKEEHFVVVTNFDGTFTIFPHK